jgi:hypothetical protein
MVRFLQRVRLDGQGSPRWLLARGTEWRMLQRVAKELKT